MVGSKFVGALPLTALNHISLVCKSVETSIDFYENVLGFVPIRRPDSFDFDGEWLFNYGIGIHLIQSDDPEGMAKKEFNPMGNHISFQCESMASVEKKLKEMEIYYLTHEFEEGGIIVDQLFLQDPDGFMIEICNCDNLPVIPVGATEPVPVCRRVKSLILQQQLQAAPMRVQCHAPAIHVKKEDAQNIPCA